MKMRDNISRNNWWCGHQGGAFPRGWCECSIRESVSSGGCHKLLGREMVMKSDNEQSYSRDVLSSLTCVICTKIIATFCWICIP